MSLLDGFWSQYKTDPNRIAFVEDDRSLSYGEFHKYIARIANNISQRSHQPADRIAIALDRGIDAAAAIFAVLYHGCVYVPLDIQNPALRLAFILKDALAKTVIGRGQCPGWVTNESLWLDLDQLDDLGVDFTPNPSASDHLSAILYTSGSTGTPKGVALSHGAMSTFADWAASTFVIKPTDRIASLAPFYFDLSVFDLYTSLSCGATVYFIPGGLPMNPSKLSAWIKANKINYWYTVPSLLSFLALKGNLRETLLPNLRCILFAGEVFPSPRLMALLDLLPNVEFFNLYGPTETNVCCYWPVDRTQLRADRSIPIGIPTCQAQLRVDEEQGELLVKGPTLFSGYWQDGKVVNPVASGGWYRTGDLVSKNEQGEYLYHGRLDRMLKCSGYRVEPAEVETLINTIPGVEQSAVIGIKDPTSGHRLAVAIALQRDQEPPQLNLEFKNRLPAYMLPTRTTIVPQLPMLRNGKIDYKCVEKFFQANMENQS